MSEFKQGMANFTSQWRVYNVIEIEIELCNMTSFRTTSDSLPSAAISFIFSCPPRREETTIVNEVVFDLKECMSLLFYASDSWVQLNGWFHVQQKQKHSTHVELLRRSVTVYHHDLNVEVEVRKELGK